jgi:hypothetical protein
MLHGLITKFMGETAQKLKLVFDAIKSTRGVYLFDEIDALAATRGDGNDVGEARRVLNSFLQFLDEDTGPSIVIATTNLAEILDRAVLRRFDLVLSYELPDAASIRQALERRLIGFPHTPVLEKVTDCAIGLSTADVVAAAEDAARRAVLGDRDSITTVDLVNSLERRRSLQGLGRSANATEFTSLSPKRPRKAASVSAKGRGGGKTPSDVLDRSGHAQALLQAIDQLPAITTDGLPGVYLEVKGRPGEPLAKDSLGSSGIELLRSAAEVVNGSTTETATVFATAQGVENLRKKIEQSRQKIRRTGRRTARSFPVAPRTPLCSEHGGHHRGGPARTMARPAGEISRWQWATHWEIWLEPSEAEAFIAQAAAYQVQIGTDRLHFPEDVVVIGLATRDHIALAVRRLGSVRALAAPAVTADFFDALEVQEQAAWVQDLAQRTTYAGGLNGGYVTLLDTALAAPTR